MTRPLLGQLTILRGIVIFEISSYIPKFQASTMNTSGDFQFSKYATPIFGPAHYFLWACQYCH